METFDLDSHLKGVYSVFPEAQHQPIIGISANYEGVDATLRDRYYKQVIAAGGTPVIIPPVADTDVIINTLQHLDGLILSGGGDHNPLWMGEEPSPRLHNINRERDLAEFLLVRLAYNRQIPMLGICRGIQTLAIALGGKVEQDIHQEVKHSQDADREEPTHSVQIVKDSTLFNIYNQEKIFVNSFHHQAVSVPGKKLRTIAKSSDGIIEAVESSEYKSILGVQWHPEWLEDEGLKIFQWLVGQANEFLNLEDDKISTSRNWAVWLHEYLVDLPGKQDVLRYVLTANAPETKDNNFTWKDFQERNNSELVAVYGNFVNRALQLTKKYWGGVVPACGELQEVDEKAIAEFKDVKEKVEQYLNVFKFREAQKEAMNLARIGNKV